MRTIQLQCGSCRKMMAISVEHLGKQVRCPHCKSVVQTPAPEPEPEPAAVSAGETSDVESPPSTEPPARIPTPSWMESAGDQPEPDASEPPPERDSIFEDQKRDDLFDEEPAKVEMPREDAEDLQESGVGFGGSTHKDADEAADFRSMRSREVPKQSNFAAYLLIFLIPYAICCTGFIVYMQIYQKDPNSLERFDYLNDIYPDAKGQKDKGSAKRIFQPPHDAPVPKNNQVRLGGTKQIGDVELTPLKVSYRKIGDEMDLILEVRAKNVSKDTQFCPVSRNFLYNAKTNRESYMFLEEVGRDTKYFPSSVEHNLKDPTGILKPGESATYEIRTDIDFRKAAPKVIGSEANFKSSAKELQWRVQVRRGLVKFKDKDVSATALIGVQFTPKDIVPLAD